MRHCCIATTAFRIVLLTWLGSVIGLEALQLDVAFDEVINCSTLNASHPISLRSDYALLIQGCSDATYSSGAAAGNAVIFLDCPVVNHTTGGGELFNTTVVIRDTVNWFFSLRCNESVVGSLNVVLQNVTVVMTKTSVGPLLNSGGLLVVVPSVNGTGSGLRVTLTDCRWTYLRDLTDDVYTPALVHVATYPIVNVSIVLKRCTLFDFTGVLFEFGSWNTAGGDLSHITILISHSIIRHQIFVSTQTRKLVCIFAGWKLRQIDGWNLTMVHSDIHCLEWSTRSQVDVIVPRVLTQLVTYDAISFVFEAEGVINDLVLLVHDCTWIMYDTLAAVTPPDAVLMTCSRMFYIASSQSMTMNLTRGLISLQRSSFHLDSVLQSELIATENCLFEDYHVEVMDCDIVINASGLCFPNGNSRICHVLRLRGIMANSTVVARGGNATLIAPAGNVPSNPVDSVTYADWVARWTQLRPKYPGSPSWNVSSPLSLINTRFLELQNCAEGCVVDISSMSVTTDVHGATMYRQDSPPSPFAYALIRSAVVAVERHAMNGAVITVTNISCDVVADFGVDPKPFSQRLTTILLDPPPPYVYECSHAIVAIGGNTTNGSVVTVRGCQASVAWNSTRAPWPQSFGTYTSLTSTSPMTAPLTVVTLSFAFIAIHATGSTSTVLSAYLMHVSALYREFILNMLAAVFLPQPSIISQSAQWVVHDSTLVMSTAPASLHTQDYGLCRANAATVGLPQQVLSGAHVLVSNISFFSSEILSSPPMNLLSVGVAYGETVRFSNASLEFHGINTANYLDWCIGSVGCLIELVAGGQLNVGDTRFKPFMLPKSLVVSSAQLPVYVSPTTINVLAIAGNGTSLILNGNTFYGFSALAPAKNSVIKGAQVELGCNTWCRVGNAGGGGGGNNFAQVCVPMSTKRLGVAPIAIQRVPAASSCNPDSRSRTLEVTASLPPPRPPFTEAQSVTLSVGTAVLFSIGSLAPGQALKTRQLSLVAFVVSRCLGDELPSFDDVYNQEIDPFNNPLRLEIFSSMPGSSHRGAIVGDVVFVVVVSAAVLVAGCVYQALALRTVLTASSLKQMWYDARLLMHFPGVVVFLASPFVQQLVMSVTVLFQAVAVGTKTTNTLDGLLAFVGVVAVLSVSGGVVVVLFVLSFDATTVVMPRSHFNSDQGESTSSTARFARRARYVRSCLWNPAFEWRSAVKKTLELESLAVSTGSAETSPKLARVADSSLDKDFVPRFGMIFEAYTPSRRSWLLVEMAWAVFFGIVGGFVPTSASSCAAIAWLSLVACCAQCVLVAVMKPYNVLVDHISVSIINVMLALIALLGLVQNSSSVVDGFTLAASILSCVMSVIGLVGVVYHRYHGGTTASTHIRRVESLHRASHRLFQSVLDDGNKPHEATTTAHFKKTKAQGLAEREQQLALLITTICTERKQLVKRLPSPSLRRKVPPSKIS